MDMAMIDRKETAMKADMFREPVFILVGLGFPPRFAP
jgi:hypothetical protein